MEKPAELQTIIVLGDGAWTRDESGKPVISPYSQERAQAAASLYLEGVGSQFIFCGGHTAGKEYPSEAEVLDDSFSTIIHKSGLILPERTIEGESLDTHENFENIKDLLSDDIVRVGLLTSEWHIHRAAMIARAAFGLEVEKLTAESILKRQYSEFKGYYRENLKTELPSKLIRESILIALLKLDPKGRIPRLLTNRRGKNLNIQF